MQTVMLFLSTCSLGRKSLNGLSIRASVIYEMASGHRMLASVGATMLYLRLHYWPFFNLGVAPKCVVGYKRSYRADIVHIILIKAGYLLLVGAFYVAGQTVSSETENVSEEINSVPDVTGTDSEVNDFKQSLSD
ncbi:hypothetical protein BgiBS90_034818, partial [Biomphalaria glabrata]